MSARASPPGVSPKPFTLLGAFGRFGAERRISLRDPATLAAFTDHVATEMQGALDDGILLQGSRTEAMFEALLISLGEYRMLRAEDAGPFEGAADMAPADFRVLLEDGTHWLIEVKNVYREKPAKQRRRVLRHKDLVRLEAYASLTGAELKVAVYWAKWSLWTLVSPRPLVNASGDLILEMGPAMMVNELARLGDRMVGTRFPLRLRLTMDPAKTSPIGPDGEVLVTIGSVEMYCADRELVDEDDQQLAWMFVQYGQWEGTEPVAVISGDRLQAIEFTWSPPDDQGQGFEMIGFLSRMFARYYAEHTLEGSGVDQLRAPLRPAWFRPLIRRERRSEELPLWTFEMQPNPEGWKKKHSGQSQRKSGPSAAEF